MAGSTSHCDLSVRARVRVPLADLLFVDARISFLWAFVASTCWNRIRPRRWIPRTGLSYVCAGSTPSSAVTAHREMGFWSQKRT